MGFLKRGAIIFIFLLLLDCVVAQNELDLTAGDSCSGWSKEILVDPMYYEASGFRQVDMKGQSLDGNGVHTAFFPGTNSFKWGDWRRIDDRDMMSGRFGSDQNYKIFDVPESGYYYIKMAIINHSLAEPTPGDWTGGEYIDFIVNDIPVCGIDIELLPPREIVYKVGIPLKKGENSIRIGQPTANGGTDYENFVLVESCGDFNRSCPTLYCTPQQVQSKCPEYLPSFPFPCKDAWGCSRWEGDCAEAQNILTRICTDVMNCGTEMFQPNPFEQQSCLYNMTCQDLDFDGYGRNCWTEDNGLKIDLPDCNDFNPKINPSAIEVCDGVDNNCDDSVDEGCPCMFGQTQTCGSIIGTCSQGVQVCLGSRWSLCGGIGYGPSKREICNNGKDDDCDGQIDELCKCIEGSVQECGSGIGACKKGQQNCFLDGLWSACAGEQVSSPEVGIACSDLIDNDCDGLIDAADPTCQENIMDISFDHCKNSYQDQDETNVDCGGIDCLPCSQVIPANQIDGIDINTHLTEGEFCGDGICNGEEDKVTCKADCEEQLPMSFSPIALWSIILMILIFLILFGLFVYIKYFKHEDPIEKLKALLKIKQSVPVKQETSFKPSQPAFKPIPKSITLEKKTQFAAKKTFTSALDRQLEESFKKSKDIFKKNFIWFFALIFFCMIFGFSMTGYYTFINDNIAISPSEITGASKEILVQGSFSPEYFINKYVFLCDGRGIGYYTAKGKNSEYPDWLKQNAIAKITYDGKGSKPIGNTFIESIDRDSELSNIFGSAKDDADNKLTGEVISANSNSFKSSYSQPVLSELLGYITKDSSNDSINEFKNTSCRPNATFSKVDLGVKGYHAQLLSDFAGRLHIAYIGEDRKVHYIIYTEIGKQTVEVPNSEISDLSDISLDLSVTGNGITYIMWRDGDNITLAKLSQNEWKIENIPSYPSVVDSTFSVDSKNVVHILYSISAPSKLLYLKSNESSWSLPYDIFSAGVSHDLNLDAQKENLYASWASGGNVYRNLVQQGPANPYYMKDFVSGPSMVLDEYGSDYIVAAGWINATNDSVDSISFFKNGIVNSVVSLNSSITSKPELLFKSSKEIVVSVVMQGRVFLTSYDGYSWLSLVKLDDSNSSNLALAKTEKKDWALYTDKSGNLVLSSFKINKCPVYGSMPQLKEYVYDDCARNAYIFACVINSNKVWDCSWYYEPIFYNAEDETAPLIRDSDMRPIARHFVAKEFDASKLGLKLGSEDTTDISSNAYRSLTMESEFKLNEFSPPELINESGIPIMAMASDPSSLKSFTATLNNAPLATIESPFYERTKELIDMPWGEPSFWGGMEGMDLSDEQKMMYCATFRELTFQAGKSMSLPGGAFFDRQENQATYEYRGGVHSLVLEDTWESGTMEFIVDNLPCDGFICEGPYNINWTSTNYTIGHNLGDNTDILDYCRSKGSKSGLALTSTAAIASITDSYSADLQPNTMFAFADENDNVLLTLDLAGMYILTGPDGQQHQGYFMHDTPYNQVDEVFPVCPGYLFDVMWGDGIATVAIIGQKKNWAEVLYEGTIYYNKDLKVKKVFFGGIPGNNRKLAVRKVGDESCSSVTLGDTDMGQGVRFYNIFGHGIGDSKTWPTYTDWENWDAGKGENTKTAGQIINCPLPAKIGNEADSLLNQNPTFKEVTFTLPVGIDNIDLALVPDKNHTIDPASGGWFFDCPSEVERGYSEDYGETVCGGLRLGCNTLKVSAKDGNDNERIKTSHFGVVDQPHSPYWSVYAQTHGYNPSLTSIPMPSVNFLPDSHGKISFLGFVADPLTDMDAFDEVLPSLNINDGWWGAYHLVTNIFVMEETIKVVNLNGNVANALFVNGIYSGGTLLPGAPSVKASLYLKPGWNRLDLIIYAYDSIKPDVLHSHWTMLSAQCDDEDSAPDDYYKREEPGNIKLSMTPSIREIGVIMNPAPLTYDEILATGSKFDYNNCPSLDIIKKYDNYEVSWISYPDGGETNDYDIGEGCREGDGYFMTSQKFTVSSSGSNIKFRSSMSDDSSGNCAAWSAVENPKILFQTYDAATSKWKTLTNGNYDFITISDGNPNTNSASKGICGATYGYTDQNYQNYGHFCFSNPPCNTITYPSTNIEDFYFLLNKNEVKVIAGKNKYLGLFTEFPGYLVHGATPGNLEAGMNSNKLESCYSNYINCKKGGQSGTLGCIRLDSSAEISE